MAYLPMSFFLFFYTTNCTFCERARSQLLSVQNYLSLPLVYANCDYSLPFCVYLNVSAVPAFGIINERYPVAVSNQLYEAEHFIEFLAKYSFVDRLNSVFLAVPSWQLYESKASYVSYLYVVSSNSSETFISYNGHLIFFTGEHSGDLKQFVAKYSIFPTYLVTVHNYTYLSLKHKLLVLADHTFDLNDEFYERYVLGVCDEQAYHFFKIGGNIIKIIDSEGGYTNVMVENDDIWGSIDLAFDTHDNRRRKSIAFIVIFFAGCLGTYAWNKQGRR